MFKLLNRIIFIFNLRKILRKVVRAINESKTVTHNNLNYSIKIRDANVQYYEFPDHFPTEFYRNHPFFDRYIFNLRKVIVSIQTGLVRTTDGYLLQESYGSLRKMFLWDNVVSHLNKNHKKSHYDFPVYFIPYKGFYHFLLEELPNMLNVLNDFSGVFIVVNELYYNKKDFYEQSLNYLKKTFNIKIIKTKYDFSAQDLFIVQHENYSGFIHLNDIKILNKFFQGLFINNNNKAFDKIYISRKKAKRRSIENENEIELYLKKIEFKIIYLEEYSFIEQVQIVAKASYIIAPHGAGLSHLCWQTKNKNVLEIFPSNIFNDCFAKLAVLLAYDYKYIRSMSINKKEYLPIKKLEKTLK